MRSVSPDGSVSRTSYADQAVAEVRLANPGNDELDRQSALLERLVADGADEVYDGLVAEDLVASWLADSPHGEIDQATTTLLDVRDALHAVTGRAGERLLLAEQDAVAVALGVPDADALLTKVASAARTVHSAWRWFGSGM